MKQLLIRVLSIAITLSSTPTVAQSVDAIGDLISTLQDIDMHVADTGFDVDNDKYSFGAKRKIAEKTTFDMGVGGKMHSSPDMELSNSYRGVDSRTNMLEDNFDPMNASPMVGLSLNHKF